MFNQENNTNQVAIGIGFTCGDNEVTIKIYLKWFSYFREEHFYLGDLEGVGRPRKAMSFSAILEEKQNNIAVLYSHPLRRYIKKSHLE